MSDSREICITHPIRPIFRVEPVDRPEGYVKVTIELEPPERPAKAYVPRDIALALAGAILSATHASPDEAMRALMHVLGSQNGARNK